ncbi:hypothetical protein [Demequina phytophila]|uniref:hypothetical protein n=1 Tax=Demequina phytophila TaxID=1638981 RepID=UPI00078584BE|nr:hypothetical protein [Demequina phytophila]
MGDDAAVTGRGVRAFAWVAAGAGAALWVLAAQGVRAFSEARGQGWLGTSEGIEGAMPWLVALFAAFGTAVVLTVVAAGRHATVRSARAGLVAAAVELVSAIVALARDFPEAGLAHLGYVLALVLVLVHAGASLVGFVVAWDAHRPVVAHGATD